MKRMLGILALMLMASLAFAYNATGGTITTDGLYTVHTFTSNGTFNVSGEINATVLIVAGGGQGGSSRGGGGGAGGLIYNTSYNATGAISVVIGIGGVGGTSTATGVKGGNSSFGILTAVGGGGGGGDPPANAPSAGGSGGGGWGAAGAAGTAGQGNDGGGSSDTFHTGGGGGGAGAVGAAGNTSNAGKGGIGLNYTINGSNVYYAGGGGGGTDGGRPAGAGGLGGGGNGSQTSATGGAGTANSGGGGGAGGNDGAPGNGGAGGSGVVIVRYLTTAPATVNVNYAANSQADGAVIEPPLFVNATTNVDACNLSVNGTMYNMTFAGSAPNGSCSINLTLADGAYSYSVFAYNSTNASVNASTANRTVVIDSILPTNLNFASPTAGAQYYVSATPNITYNLTFVETNFRNCTVAVNGTTYNMTKVNATLCIYSFPNSPANFTYSGSVCDLAEHCVGMANQSVSGFSYSTLVGFSNPESDIAPDNISLNISLQNYAGDLSATLQYNGTNYTPNQSGSNFYYLVNPPVLANNSTTISIAWLFTFLNSTPVLSANTSNTTTLLFANMTDCNVVNGTRIILFSFFDQAAVATPTNSTMDATFTLTAANGSYARNFSYNFSTPVPSVGLCLNLNSGTYYVDSIQQFRASGYRNLYYYLLNQSITVPTQYNVSLYNLNTTGSVATQYIILQGASQAVENAYVQVLRYYPATNQLILVSMGKSNVNGIAESYAVANEVNYRYVVIKDNQILFTSGTATLPCDPSATLCSSTIYVSSAQANEYSAFINAVGVGCVVNTTAGTVYCTSNNPSGTGTKLTLRLYEIGTYSNPLVCENSVNTGSGTVICTIPSANKSYYYVGSAAIGSDVIIGSGAINAGVVAQYDLIMGLFATILLVGGLAAFGLMFGLVGVILGADLGLVIAVLAGFLSVDPIYLVPVISISLVLAWVLAIAQSPRG